MSNQADIKGDRAEILVRLPAELVARVDAYIDRVAPKQITKPTRNDAMIALLRRGLGEATRPR